MNMLLNLESPVTTAHRAKLVYIYVLQSTAGQVRQHQESTELQYRLVDRAALFGWPKERIEIIDDDLGKSGTSSDSRGGFQRLIAEIGLGKAGLVLSLDASRLARNNHDWHQLLELCSLFGVLIADGERVYNPCAYHDRLLLGLSGIMSEAELHQIKLRLHQGERQKAARGELRLALPAGLADGRDGRIGFNPDEEVHARLLHLFAKFRELRSAKAVMRHFQEANFLVPVRPLDGPSPHDVVWRPASNARILQVLKNPAYAGAYVYGRRRRTPIGRRSGSRQGATEAVAIQDWPVCLKDAFPGYLDWEEFMANQRRLADNLNHYDANRHGVPRQGNALLQGIAICGRCGRRMGLHYSGQNGNYPVYLCRADHTRAFAALGGVPKLLVPDNTKVAVIKACLYEPQVNRTYAEMAAHYDTAILPARPRRPRDKAKVEVAVLIIERWLLGRLRHRRFYSLAELNAAIGELLRQLNDERPIRRLGVPRRALFEELDRPNLNALPAQPYSFAEWRVRRVGVDYHVELEGHFYSVPHRFARNEVEVRLTPRAVEIFLKGERIAAPLRASSNHRHTPVPEHMPSSHRRSADWTVERIRREAASIGPAIAALCELILERRPHPEPRLRACLGIVRLVRPFGADRLEAAATRAIEIGTLTYGSVRSILDNKLDHQAAPRPPDNGVPILPPNIRGPPLRRMQCLPIQCSTS